MALSGLLPDRYHTEYVLLPPGDNQSVLYQSVLSHDAEGFGDIADIVGNTAGILIYVGATIAGAGLFTKSGAFSLSGYPIFTDNPSEPFAGCCPMPPDCTASVFRRIQEGEPHPWDSPGCSLR